MSKNVICTDSSARTGYFGRSGSLRRRGNFDDGATPYRWVLVEGGPSLAVHELSPRKTTTYPAPGLPLVDAVVPGRTTQEKAQENRAAIYARVSDKSQDGEDKTSIAEQIGDMEAYCERKGLTITKTETAWEGGLDPTAEEIGEVDQPCHDVSVYINVE